MRNRWKRNLAGIMLLVMMLVVLPTNVAQAATYQKGSKGTNVQYLQQNLAFLGCSPGSADGSYGAKTVAAVKSLQKMLHMEETGVVDDKLDALIKGTVRDVQTYLQKKGFYSGELDGIKGSMMAAGYKKLQKELGYQQTGVFDLEVAKIILKDSSYVGTLNDLKEFVDRCDGVYEDKNTEYMRQMAECISELEVVSKEGIAETNVTVALYKKMSEVSTKNLLWGEENRALIESVVQSNAELLLTLYNTVLSDNMKPHKLQGIQEKLLVYQLTIEDSFNGVYQILGEMEEYKWLSSKNKERINELCELLREYQTSLPKCQEIYDYALILLEAGQRGRTQIVGGYAYFMCANFSEKYVYNQNDYDKFEMPDGRNVGCTATALAISYSIYNDLFLMPDDKEIEWNEETYAMKYPWGPQMSHDATYCGKEDNVETLADDRLKYIYDNYVVADIPVVIRLERVNNPQDGDNGHSVVVIGIRVDSDVESLTYDDILVADPNGAKVHTLTESMSNGRYKLSSGWHLAYPNEAE